ncbi:hypothetical protein ACQKFK_15110 [Bacillus mycoides]|uniref:hypothetical protein n=1 Tax=Bacillus TaxID=1386 RepID=UPI002E1DAC04|nr:hypothetical protein [Bacillus mycoides]
MRDTAFYAKRFERDVVNKEEFTEGIQRIGEVIVNQLKKEEITYDEAYGSLEYAYQLLKYQSNFVKL